ncbi:MAG: methylmalonyl-CoA mutase family protein [Saprospiraceae bacterium]
MKPDFSKIPLDKEIFNKKENKTETKSWHAPEKIDIPEQFSEEVLTDMEHLDFAAGIPPFLRGPYGSMYTIRPWTIRQYAGFSTAEESNAFYRRNLEQGQKDFQWLLILLPIADMILTIPG